MTALKSINSADDVTSLLEAEFAKVPACGHCGAESFSKWGVSTGVKRYMCKTCNRTFNALTGTPLAHLHKREEWLEYPRAIVDWPASGNTTMLASVCAMRLTVLVAMSGGR